MSSPSSSAPPSPGSAKSNRKSKKWFPLGANKSNTLSVHCIHCPRRIQVNIPPDANSPPLEVYPENRIRTSKYTVVNFVPKNILFQFSRIANLYFLLIIILQAFPSIGTTVPILSAVPLLTIVSITALKDGFEDYKRHVNDNQVNKTETLTLKNWKNWNIVDVTSSWKNTLTRFLNKSVAPLENTPINSQPPEFGPTAWANIQVGDFVKIRDNELIPADVIILSTSEPNNVAYVETKNLDGETNLKLRQGIQELSHLKTASDCVSTKFCIDSESPDINLYAYSGTISIPAASPNAAPVTIPVTIDSLLLRGSILRNTEWVIGIVAYTGIHTKMILNSGETPSKRSRIDRAMNREISFNFVILFILCVICASSSAQLSDMFWVFGYNNAKFFNETKAKPFDNGFNTFWASLVIFQNIVPISLYISIEFVKTLQAFFIYSDLDMYYEKSDKTCVPKTWTISDDLGQIEYIFSDKTGTLTQNVMEFRRCSINGFIYGIPTADSDSSQVEAAIAAMKVERNSIYDNPYISNHNTFVDPTIFRHLKGEMHGSYQKNLIEMFFMLLATCHSVIADIKDTPDKRKVITYKAQSPDEAALVSTARDMGFTFLKNEQNVIHLDVMGRTVKWKVLCTLEFNSTRKRMSMILKKLGGENAANDKRDNEGEIVLFSKGADSVIYERLKEGQNMLKDQTMQDLEEFANEGLRTLCLAYRNLSAKEYNEFQVKYHAAATAIENREEKIAAVAEEIEKELTLIGATAIEDKLQDGVPDTIAKLAQAGIKLWVLTGDKVETAINIGFSCNLLTAEMALIQLKANDKPSVLKQIKDTMTKFLFDPHRTYALIVDGATLSHCLSSGCRDEFLALCTKCKSVICCRVSPLQKAQVVALVRRTLGVMTLAIGDGANDVSMIQEADVGIGISGEEGVQAALAADYSFSQFRYLTKLILVHGRWSYFRIASMILNFFYKNIVWVFVMFWYQIHAGFSAELMYDYTYLMFYNMIFTVLPVIVQGIFDQDITPESCIKYAEVYRMGIRQTLYTHSRFWLFVLDAVYQSLISFWGPYFIYVSGVVNPTGQEVSKHEFTAAVASTVIITANVYVGMNIHNWTWIVFIGIFVCAFSSIIYIPIYSSMPFGGYYGLVEIVYNEATFFLTIILTTVTCLLPNFLAKYMHATFSPTDIDLIREIQKFGSQRLNEVELKPVSTDKRIEAQKASEKDRVILNIPDNIQELQNESLQKTGQIEIITTPAEAVLDHAPTHNTDSPASLPTVSQIDMYASYETPNSSNPSIQSSQQNVDIHMPPISTTNLADNAVPKIQTVSRGLSLQKSSNSGISHRSSAKSVIFDAQSNTAIANTGFAFSREDKKDRIFYEDNVDNNRMSKAVVTSPTADSFKSLRKSATLSRVLQNFTNPSTVAGSSSTFPGSKRPASTVSTWAAGIMTEMERVFGEGSHPPGQEESRIGNDNYVPSRGLETVEERRESKAF